MEEKRYCTGSDETPRTKEDAERVAREKSYRTGGYASVRLVADRGFEVSLFYGGARCAAVK